MQVGQNHSKNPLRSCIKPFNIHRPEKVDAFFNGLFIF